MDKSIKEMAPNKAPGTDRLTAIFYQFFWEDIREISSQAIMKCIERITIHNNIRLILDLVDYSEVIQKEGFL